VGGGTASPQTTWYFRGQQKELMVIKNMWVRKKDDKEDSVGKGMGCNQRGAKGKKKKTAWGVERGFFWVAREIRCRVVGS